MKLHRFYLTDTKLGEDLVLANESLFRQWSKVLRFEVGREVALFNSEGFEALYQIAKYGSDKSVYVQFVRELEPKAAKTGLYLCFALLKKDKNEWVLQKGTELGASHFLPLMTDRTEKTGFDEDRANKIVIEAAEQCGRTDIPTVSEPKSLQSALRDLEQVAAIYIAEQGTGTLEVSEDEKAKAIFIGPEGGWSDAEKQLFTDLGAQHIQLSPFTLRAETAAIVATARLAV